MALEAIQAQAGHRSIESTRIYLHLANDWLAGEYRRASEAIDAQALAGAVMPAAVMLLPSEHDQVEDYLAGDRAGCSKGSRTLHGPGGTLVRRQAATRRRMGPA